MVDPEVAEREFPSDGDPDKIDEEQQRIASYSKELHELEKKVDGSDPSVKKLVNLSLSILHTCRFLLHCLRSVESELKKEDEGLFNLFGDEFPDSWEG